ncbi:PepSY-associated TM helix domain-containing protein, partial [Acinetobacter baumannii]
AAIPERPVTFITAASVPTEPWRIWYAWPTGKRGGSSRGELHYFDPATGTLLPEARGQRFFATVKLLHRTLLADEVGKQIVGASTIALVVMALSG